MKIEKYKYFLYHFRWQLSTPILAGANIILFKKFRIDNFIVGAIIANLVGASIFYYVDKFIFKSLKLDIFWEIKDGIICSDCKKVVSRGYRIIKSDNYDKVKDTNPKFRCEKCSIRKTDELKEKGLIDDNSS